MGTVVEETTSYTISTVPGGEPLGMENGAIPDENIIASSSAGPAPPYLGRLNASASWCTAKSNDCYLQVDLGSLHLLCAVAIQGNPGGNRDYVKRYKLQCSSDGVDWTMYEENGNDIIEGNSDNNSVKRKDLEQEFITRYVRFCPVDWYCWPCMRVELYGAALNIGDKLAQLESEEGGGFVVDKVMVTTYETEVDEKDQDYLVHIYTGDKWGAGTDANVLITIFGQDGDSGERKLDNNKNNFETGQKDSFTVTCPSLGRLNKIRIGHDNTGFGAAWFLDKVTVEDPKTGEAVDFPCQRWFSTSEEDGQITRELTRADEKSDDIVVDIGYNYLVHIYTGDKWGAGTDANVLITIFGEDSDSGERRLDNNKNNFENGQKDSFTLSCATSLGRLNKIRIGHDNTGFSAAWFLDKVTVEDPKTGDAIAFPCQRWFSTSEDDGQITRELTRANGIDNESVVDKGHDYLVHIYTGDEWGAGTDANVLITIFGEDSDSGERRLDNNKNNFENGQKDSFTVSCATPLGRLNKIRIGHDNTGFGAAWFLDKVTVEDPKTGETVEFPCQRWFSTSEDDGKITRELPRAVSNKDEEKTVVIEEITDLKSVEGGGFDNVLVPADETHVEKNGEPGQDEISLKEQEKRIIREAKERQRKEEEQRNRLEEIQIIIEQEEGKRKLSGEDMDKERAEAEARMKLVLDEERKMQRREKPDGEDKTQQQERPQEIEEKHSPEYSRIEEEHRRRMEEISAILEDDEKRRVREKEEKRKTEEDARKKREEERRKRDNELKQKREEERRKWEEEHRKWEEERKKRDRDLEAVLEEGRRKRAEDRLKREEELKANREEERRKREEERKKRIEIEMKKLEDLKREREERLNRNRANVVVVDLDRTSTSEKDKEKDTKNRQEEKRRKEEGWKKAVETPRQIEDDLKKFRDEERKRLEEERKKLQESEHAQAEVEKEFKSELRVRRLGEPETTTHVTVASVQLGPARDVTIAEEKRRIEWRMEKIERDRQLREEEERKRREEVDRKRKEQEESLRQEQERRQKEQEEERQRRREEMRLKREEEEKQKQEEAECRRQEEDARRKHSLEERRKRLEEDRKKRENEERIWRREMEQGKQKEEEERQKQIESKKIKRRSIDRKRFEEEEKKRLDDIERKKNEEEEKARMEDEQRRREERERWKMKQAEKRRSGEIYRRKSEEDLRTREDRASFKERQRKKRDSKSFETKWMFVNGEKVEAPDDEAIVVAERDTSYTEPDVFTNESPEMKYISVKTTETKRTQEKRTQERPVDTDEKDSSQTTSTIRVISTTTTITRTRSQGSSDKLSRAESEEVPLNGDVMPYRSQPHCDHLLPTDPAVQMAEEMSFFDKYEENEGKLRPFPSWYGGLDMGSLPHLYSPSNPITDSDVDILLAIESEDFSGWKRVKKSRELEIYSRKGTERGSPPITKAVMVLKDIPYRDAIDLVSDWNERAKWDKTFDGVSFLDQMADFKVLKCSQKKKNRCLVLASLDREDEEPYYAWTWKAAKHPSVPGEDTKVTVLRLDTEICGAIIRPYHDATQSSKITIITQVRGSVPSPLKSTYLTGNPSKWLIWLKKHHDSQLTNTAEKPEDDTEKDEDHKNKDDSSSVSSASDKQD